jgi:uncharacterized protein (DUF58 family)
MSNNLSAIRKIRLDNWLLPLFIIALIVIQIFYPQKTWEILLYGFGSAFLLSFVWAYSLFKGINFKREMRLNWAKVGDVFHEKFNIENSSRFSALWVSLTDYSNLPDYQVNAIWHVKRKTDKSWIKGSACYVRGSFKVGPTDIETSDPFGVFKIQIHYPESREMLVIPPIIQLSSIGIASGDLSGEGKRKKQSINKTTTSTSVREYIPGDNLHTIHWLTSARRDDVYVRTFDKTPSSDWWILLDMDERIQVGSGNEATDEYAIILAASIANRGLQFGRAVGLVAEGKKSVWLPPKTGNGIRWEILNSLANIKCGTETLSSLIANNQRRIGRNTSAIIITASVDQEWLNSLSMLMKKGVTPTILMLEPKAFGGKLKSDNIISTLASWGVNYYQFTPEIYTRPDIHNFFVEQNTYKKTSRQITGYLDWGKFK